jgi:hypothetical protein
MESSGANLQPHNPNPGDPVSVFIDSGAPLPETYGDNCLVIMPRDPRTLFVYWDIQPSRFEPLRKEWGEGLNQSVTVLRVFDMTDHPVNGGVSAPFFDVEIDTNVQKWYVSVPHPGRNYKVEFGLRLTNNTFISILTSNMVIVPNGFVSDDVDAQWVTVRTAEELEAWEKVLHNVDISRGSAEFSRQMAQRWQFLKSVFSMGIHPSSMPSSLPNSRTRHE